MLILVSIHLLSLIGLVTISKHIISLLKWAYITFLRPPKHLKQTYGSWALITGSTDGIGKAFAFALAAHNLNLVLVSRNPNKLQQVSIEIKQKFPNVIIKVLALDFSRDDISYVIGEIEKVVKGLDMGVLVNNVGITYPKAMYFHELEEGICMKILRVNMGAINGVTKAVLPNMLSKRKGAIINIGSGAAIVVPSHPLYALYAATKAYTDQLSRSLHVEYKHLGIHVQCQVPLYVATKMALNVASVEGTTLFVPSADSYVAAAVKRIGCEARCTPYWAHSLQWWISSFAPRSWLDAWRLSIGIRRRSPKSNVSTK